MDGVSFRVGPTWRSSSSKLLYSQIVRVIRHLCRLYHNRPLAAVDPPRFKLHAVWNGEFFVVVVVVVVVVELLVVPASESESIDDPGSTGGEGRGTKGAPGLCPFRGLLFAVVPSIALRPIGDVVYFHGRGHHPHRHSVVGKVTTTSPGHRGPGTQLQNTHEHTFTTLQSCAIHTGSE